MREVLLVASGGGHLQQMRLLADRLPYSGHRRWITFDTPQSRSLLVDEDVTCVPYVGPRDYRGLAQNLLLSTRVGVNKSTEAVISTGSGLALSYLPHSGLRNIPTHYIESATRVLGPSLTGQILSRCPGVRVHTQYESWATGRWHYAGSVFEGFVVTQTPPERAERPLKKVVVSLGTIKPYGFRRLIERLIDLVPRAAEITWQTGYTDVEGLPIAAHKMLPHHELLARIAEADLLIAHAGTGIALTGLSAGVCPVLVPREAAYGEHVDDHQVQIARLLADAGLAVSSPVGELTTDHLQLARSRTVMPGDSPTPLALM